MDANGAIDIVNGLLIAPFYVKTPARQTGTITCRASSRGITPATINIEVFPAPGRYDF